MKAVFHQITMSLKTTARFSTNSENGKAVTLRTREPLAGARAFQKALVNLCCAKRLRSWTAPPPNRTSPKTLSANYRDDRLNAQKMPPIGWTVAEIILMESIVGKTTHVEHGRWPLCGSTS